LYLLIKDKGQFRFGNKTQTQTANANANKRNMGGLVVMVRMAMELQHSGHRTFLLLKLKDKKRAGGMSPEPRLAHCSLSLSLFNLASLSRKTLPPTLDPFDTIVQLLNMLGRETNKAQHTMHNAQDKIAKSQRSSGKERRANGKGQRRQAI
jgi:hypothetical protein